MNFRKTLGCAAGALFLSTLLPIHTASAQKIAFLGGIVKDKKTAKIDPEKSYLMVETDVAMTMTFVKIPSQAELDDWENQRKEALAKAVDKYERRLKSYQRRIKNYKPKAGGLRAPVKPTDPTEEGFFWPDLEYNFKFDVGPSNRFSKADGASLYLREVTAGEYYYYGTGPLALPVCACMGTVSFNVEAGTITALQVGIGAVNAQGEMIAAPEPDISKHDGRVRYQLVVEAPSDAVFDPRLPREMIQPADFAPRGSRENWGGREVSRVAPIVGVFEYSDRGEMIDLREGK